MVKAVVDEPDQVQVSEIVTDSSLVIELKVAQEDIGQVIGRHGHTAEAMRTILSAAAKPRKRVTLEIADYNTPSTTSATMLRRKRERP